MIISAILYIYIMVYYDFTLRSFFRVATFVYWERRLNGLLRCHSHTPSATCGNLGGSRLKFQAGEVGKHQNPAKIGSFSKTCGFCLETSYPLVN